MVEVTVISSTIVPKHIDQSGRAKIHLTPHDLDLLYLVYPQSGLLFPKSDPDTHIVPRLKAALSIALEIYFPFAGRLVKVNNHEDDTVSFYIDCDGSGAKFVHAKAESVSVNDLLKSNGSVPYFIGHFFPANDVESHDALILEPLLALQVTEMKDGVLKCMIKISVVASSPRFEVYDQDFGWGKPIAARAGPGNGVGGLLVMFRGVEEESIDVHAILSSSLWSNVLMNLYAE